MAAAAVVVARSVLAMSVVAIVVVVAIAVVVAMSVVMPAAAKVSPPVFHLRLICMRGYSSFHSMFAIVSL